MAFLTAHFTLNHLAKLRSRRTRADSRGVLAEWGLTAVALARRIEREIFATAGSPEKRALLKSLCVAHVMDSRSAKFRR